jgi:hypothetical protein
VSVINKMLRDLDSRQAAGAVPVIAPQSRTGIARDTLIVNTSDGTLQGRAWLPKGLLAATSVVALAAAGLWWYLNQTQRPEPVKPVVAAAPVAAPAAAVVLPVLAPAIPASAPELVPVAAPPQVAPADVSVKVDSTLSRVPTPDKNKKPVVQTQPRTAERPQSRQPTAVLPANIPAALPQVPPSVSKQSAAMEVLAQAQSLWSSGSQEAAMDLVREALTSAEQAYISGTSAGNNSVLAALAREMARMQLAQGQVSQTLALLTRLEPALAGVADIWAIRGNAAQRLGRHAESAAAYQAALTLRPNEARWMLGAAVSLAAQGQTVAAAELAEKARAGGALSPEVAAYLRQLGVILPER